MFGQRGVITPGILVEQPPHIGLGHRRRVLAGAEPRQLQPRAVIILRFGAARHMESRLGAIAIANSVADRAEREPGGGEAGHRLDRLCQDIRCAGEVAARGQFDRGLVTAVADEVAGRYEQWAGVRREMLAPGSREQLRCRAPLLIGVIFPRQILWRAEVIGVQRSWLP